MRHHIESSAHEHPSWSTPWRSVLAPADRRVLARIRLADEGHGYDPFGLSREGVAAGLAMTYPLHRFYFRVQSHGTANIPTRGATLLCANHSGTVPIDAAMIWADVVRRVGRVPRPTADRFVPALPFAWELFAGAGAVAGARGNLDRLLSVGELPLIFPEGVPGIGKPFGERYRLRPFRVGHAELAIRHGVPVVPIAVIGAEEQLPLIGRLPRLGALLGVPYVPIPAVPLPLPVRYHLHYGAPIDLRAELGDDADDPVIARRGAARVRDAVQRLVDDGVRQRAGIFQ